MRMEVSDIGMTLQEIKELKRQLGLTNDQLSSLSGVPLGTVQKVLGNTTSAPRQTTLRKLETALAKELGLRKSPAPYPKDPGIRHPDKTPPACGAAYPANSQQDPGMFLREPSAPYHINPADPSTQKYTIQDYYSLP